jgi:NADH:ubiquinone oxidoreductase, NADH-binding (51 kD) subunit
VVLAGRDRVLGGTKVFALAGKVKHTGLVEVPLGTPLRDVVFDIGGGVLDDRELKAIQTGGRRAASSRRTGPTCPSTSTRSRRPARSWDRAE